MNRLFKILKDEETRWNWFDINRYLHLIDNKNLKEKSLWAMDITRDFFYLCDFVKYVLVMWWLYFALYNKICTKT